MLADTRTAQLKLVFGGIDAGFGEIDIVHLKEGKLYVARAIAYQKPKLPIDSDYNFPTKLRDGRGKDGVVNAFEDLWNVIQLTQPSDWTGTSIALNELTAFWYSNIDMSGQNEKVWARRVATFK